MMLLKIFFVLVATVGASRIQGSSQNPVKFSTKCKEEVKGIQVKQKAVAACEDKGGYTQLAIKHLQTGNKTAALKTVRESFQVCARLSETCAKEMASLVVTQMLFSGVAVSDTCRKSAEAVQKDQQKKEEVAKCEQE